MKKWAKVEFKQTQGETTSISFYYKDVGTVNDALGTIGIAYIGVDLGGGYQNVVGLKLMVPNDSIAYVLSGEVPDDSVA